jgi:hypothetical protein
MASNGFLTRVIADAHKHTPAAQRWAGRAPMQAGALSAVPPKVLSEAPSQAGLLELEPMAVAELASKFGMPARPGADVASADAAALAASAPSVESMAMPRTAWPVDPPGVAARSADRSTAEQRAPRTSEATRDAHPVSAPAAAAPAVTEAALPRRPASRQGVGPPEPTAASRLARPAESESNPPTDLPGALRRNALEPFARAPVVDGAGSAPAPDAPPRALVTDAVPGLLQGSTAPGWVRQVPRQTAREEDDLGGAARGRRPLPDAPAPSLPRAIEPMATQVRAASPPARHEAPEARHGTAETRQLERRDPPAARERTSTVLPPRVHIGRIDVVVEVAAPTAAASPRSAAHAAPSDTASRLYLRGL